MDDSNAKKFQKDLNGGLVGLVLLAILDQSAEDLYGYEIAKRLAAGKTLKDLRDLRSIARRRMQGEGHACHAGCSGPDRMS